MSQPLFCHLHTLILCKIFPFVAFYSSLDPRRVQRLCTKSTRKEKRQQTILDTSPLTALCCFGPLPCHRAGPSNSSHWSLRVSVGQWLSTFFVLYSHHPYSMITSNLNVDLKIQYPQKVDIWIFLPY